MKRLAVVVVLLLAVPCLALGQAQPPKPGSEVEKLAFYVGTWKLEGDLRAGPWGPAGKASGTSICEWFAGGFHVACRGEFEPIGSSVKMTNLEIVSYDAAAKAYTYHGITSFGTTVSARGSVNGNTWTWLWDEKVAGKPAKFRETRVEKSPTSHTFRIEYSVKGGPWTILEEGKATKVK
jgi:Protein of unknown function (DUF1579)